MPGLRRLRDPRRGAGFMPELGLARERIVFVSGIGCAARFPYYMQTYGMHSIHGRAPAIATGLSTSRPDLSVWVVTGDGDALSIGGNHLIHALRRNVNLTILLFNNQVYGLTKGQYSPTSPVGQRTGSTPMGSIDHPFNPLSVALGAEATFVARAIDTDRKHLTEVLRAAAQHRGAAFVEIFQNCNIYNDGAFDPVREDKDNRIYLRHGEPIRFGAEGERGVVRNADGSRGGRRGRGRRGRVARHDEHAEEPSLAFALSGSRCRRSARRRSASSATSSARLRRPDERAGRGSARRTWRGRAAALLQSGDHLAGRVVPAFRRAAAPRGTSRSSAATSEVTTHTTPVTENASSVPPTSASQPATSPPTGVKPANANSHRAEYASRSSSGDDSWMSDWLLAVQSVKQTPVTNRSAAETAIVSCGARASSAMPNPSVPSSSTFQLARASAADRRAPTRAPVPKLAERIPNTSGPAPSVSDASTGTSTWKLKPTVLRIIPISSTSRRRGECQANSIPSRAPARIVGRSSVRSGRTRMAASARGS